MEKSEDKKNYNNNNYISILRKILHKPIIVEFIFSYIKKRPFMIFDLVERDELIKDQINSFFKNSKKNNYLSHSLNNNINIILFYKNVKELLKYSTNNLNPYLFENFFFENNMKPSFFNYTSQYISNKIDQENNNNIKDIYNNKSELNNIYYELMKQFKNIQLVYLPKINPKTKELYKDGLYIEENIINNSNILKQEIDVLYCIIDDNEYYNNIASIRKNILINKIYFIFVKGNNNNIFNGITKYLNKINSTHIKEIIFGKKFLDNIFSIYENIFVNNKKFYIPNLQNIILIDINNYNVDKLKIYLALSILFENSNKNNIYINGNKIFNSKYFKNENLENLEKVQNLSQNSALIKIHNLTFIKNKSFMKIIKEYIDMKNITSIALYIYEEKNKNYNNFKNNFEKYFFPLNNKNLLIYSEIPFKILTKKAAATKKFKKNSLLLFKNKNDKKFIVYIKEISEYIDVNNYELWGEYSNIEKFSFIYDYNNIIIYFDEKDLESYLNSLNEFENIKKEKDTKYLDNDNDINFNSDIKNKKKKKKRNLKPSINIEDIY